MKKIQIEEVQFTTTWDSDRMYVSANYRNRLFAKLSFTTPGNPEEFIKTDEFNDMMKKPLLKRIQSELDALNE